MDSFEPWLDRLVTYQRRRRCPLANCAFWRGSRLAAGNVSRRWERMVSVERLFVDTPYVLGDAANAACGTRYRDYVSWDYAVLIQLPTVQDGEAGWGVTRGPAGAGGQFLSGAHPGQASDRGDDQPPPGTLHR